MPNIAAYKAATFHASKTFTYLSWNQKPERTEFVVMDRTNSVAESGHARPIFRQQLLLPFSFFCNAPVEAFALLRHIRRLYRIGNSRPVTAVCPARKPPTLGIPRPVPAASSTDAQWLGPKARH